MITLNANRPVRLCDGVRRRDFLHAGALGLLGLSLGDLFAMRAEGAAAGDRDVSCISLMLVGAPGQLDTWDMKPDAPAAYRGPYRPIPTNVAGMQISELFPRMAALADKYALLRSVYYSGIPVHDAGHQLMQTGRLFREGVEYPHVGSVLGFAKGSTRGLPPHVLLPRPLGHTGGNMPHGQSAGFLGRRFDPFVPSRAMGTQTAVAGQDIGPSGIAARSVNGPVRLSQIDADRRGSLRALVDDSVRQVERAAGNRDRRFHGDAGYAILTSSKARAAFDLTSESDATKDRYGRNRFGMSCLLARRLVEAGVRFVTVNMFDTVFNELTWDIHGSAPFSDITAYEQLGPMFDNAYSSLIEDLDSRGLLPTTLVVSMGEFGRTPKINAAGGRDHWPQCWTIAMAGGGVQGGQVIGASDEIAAYPKDRPVPAASIAATVMHALGLNLDVRLPGPDGQPIRLVDEGVEPVLELF